MKIHLMLEFAPLNDDRTLVSLRLGDRKLVKWNMLDPKIHEVIIPNDDVFSTCYKCTVIEALSVLLEDLLSEEEAEDHDNNRMD